MKKEIRFCLFFFSLLAFPIWVLSQTPGRAGLSSYGREKGHCPERIFFSPVLRSLEGGKQESRSQSPARISQVPAGKAVVILTAEDVWEDGSGYQMLLDGQASATGKWWANDSAFPLYGFQAGDVYSGCAYRVPENADPDLNTSHRVCAGSAYAEIPAGTYDLAVVNPTPGKTVYMANGGAFDDFVFAEGECYEFYVYKGGSGGHDTVTVRKFQDTDLSLVSLLSPFSGCDLGSQGIEVCLRNEGSRDIEAGSVKLRYTIDGGEPVEETLDRRLSWWDTCHFRFAREADMEEFRDYEIRIEIVWEQDRNPENNTVSATVSNLQPVLDLPFTEDFSDRQNLENRHWTIIDANGDGTTWQFASNLGHDAQDESRGSSMACFGVWAEASDDYLISPPIALKAGPARISFYSRILTSGSVYTESLAVFMGRNLDVSAMDSLISFDDLTNNTWEKFPINVDIPQDGSYFFAIKAQSKANMFGVYVDDVFVDTGSFVGTPDLEIRSFDLPAPDCGLTEAVISVELRNRGDNDIDSFYLAYKVNGGPEVNQVFRQRIPMQGKVRVSFDRPADFSQESVYRVEVSGGCEGESNTENNRLVRTTEHIVPYRVPYRSDFTDSLQWVPDKEDSWVYNTQGGYFSLRKMGNLVSHCITLEPGKYIFSFEYRAGQMLGTFPWPVYFNIAMGPSGTDPLWWTDPIATYPMANTQDKFQWDEFVFEVEQTADYSIAFVPLSVDTLLIRDIRIERMGENDMAVSSAPVFPLGIPSGQSGGEYVLRIPVANRGLSDEKEVRVEVSCQGEVIGTSAPDSVRAESVSVMEVPVRLPFCRGGSSLKLTAQVRISAQDAFPENDTLSFFMSFTDSSYVYDHVGEYDMREGEGLGAQYPVEAGYVVDLQRPDTLTSVSVGFCKSRDMDFALAVYRTDGYVRGEKIYEGLFRRGIGGQMQTFPTGPVVLPSGLYLVVVGQTGYRYMQLASDGELDGYVVIPQADNDSLYYQKGFGYAAVRPNFGEAEVHAVDLFAHSLSLPDTGLYSEKQEVKARIGNQGTQTARGVKVGLRVDKQVYETEVDSVPPYALVEVVFRADLSQEGERFLRLQAESDQDGNPANDVYEKYVWSQPSADPYVMDFEHCTVFSIGDFNPAWQPVDLDGAPTNFITSAGWDNMGEPQAFMAYDAARTYPSLENYMQAFQGNKFGICYASKADTNNDWLISPKLLLPEKEASISLYVMSFDPDYGLEQYRILVSETDNRPESFRMVGEQGSAPGRWTRVERDLSDYAGKEVYLALQCVSSDCYAFLVDDIRVSRPEETGNAQETASCGFSLEMYPNPASSSVEISVRGTTIRGIELYTLAGRKVYSRRGGIDAATYAFSVGNLPAGLYFVQVETEKGVQVLKLVVSR